MTGKPLANIDIDCFGYTQERTKWTKAVGRRYNVVTKLFTASTDDQGIWLAGEDKLSRGYNWLITAGSKDGRLAYMGFENVWYHRQHDAEYNQT